MRSDQKLGLVLSGGGLRGIAHIGLIRLLEELHIEPAYVAGTSAGAIVGALYAAGYTAEAILEFFLRTKLLDWKKYAFRKAGILDLQRYLPVLSEYLPDNRFDQLKKKLFVTRTNLETGAGEIISSGELHRNILASAALPILFAPVEIDDTLYADGGIVNNFPVEPLLPHCSTLIGMYVNPLAMKKKQQLKHTLAVVERAFHIGLANHSMPKFKFCNPMIIPEKLRFHSLIDVRHSRDIFDIGYAAAMEHRPALLQLHNP
ncbi:MAG: patatin-like phospholipase family protein [Saprospiraceae bacterium]|nr:patatin-like phospholipase family protein [Lewinella sp.]